MDWRDELRQASFRGVPFQVRMAEVATGRRLVVHEFFDGGHDTEDLGGLIDQVRFEAFVLGLDYRAQRDALVAACRKLGPGELVHPYWGAMQVECLGVTVREITTQQGMATLALSFIEASTETASTESQPNGAGAAADAAGDAAEQVFTDEVGLEGQPSHVAEAAGNEAERVALELAGLSLGGLPGALARYSRQAFDLADGVLEQIAKPYEWAQAMRLVVASIRTSAGGRKMALQLYLGLLELEPSPGSAGGNLPPAAAAAGAAVLGLLQRFAAAEAVRTATEVTWGYRDEAEEVRDRLAGHIDRLAEGAPDEAYLELMALLGAMRGAVPPAGEQLPDLVTTTVPGLTPSLVLAYELYGTADREPEVVARNRGTVRHPGQIPAGTRLEVLSV